MAPDLDPVSNVFFQLYLFLNLHILVLLPSRIWFALMSRSIWPILTQPWLHLFCALIVLQFSPTFSNPVCVLTFLHSGDVSYTPTHTQRPPGGLSLGVGYQRELQLPTWLRAVLPCCAHLRRKWNVERRPASVLAWVIILSFQDNYNDNYRGLWRKSPYV